MGEWVRRCGGGWAGARASRARGLLPRMHAGRRCAGGAAVVATARYSPYDAPMTAVMTWKNAWVGAQGRAGTAHRELANWRVLRATQGAARGLAPPHPTAGQGPPACRKVAAGAPLLSPAPMCRGAAPPARARPAWCPACTGAFGTESARVAGDAVMCFAIQARRWAGGGRAVFRARPLGRHPQGRLDSSAAGRSRPRTKQKQAASCGDECGGAAPCTHLTLPCHVPAPAHSATHPHSHPPHPRNKRASGSSCATASGRGSPCAVQAPRRHLASPSPLCHPPQTGRPCRLDPCWLRRRGEKRLGLRRQVVCVQPTALTGIERCHARPLGAGGGRGRRAQNPAAAFAGLPPPRMARSAALHKHLVEHLAGGGDWRSPCPSNSLATRPSRLQSDLLPFRWRDKSPRTRAPLFTAPMT